MSRLTPEQTAARVLAWCLDSPRKVGAHHHLVADLRRAMACGEPVAAILAQIAVAIPGGHHGR